MSNYEATRYDFDGANLTNIEGVNTGIIVPWTDSSIPSGFLECDGSAVSRVTYAALFAVIGTTYGSGNGSTTFDLPDLQDSVVNHTSNNKAFASTGGANTVASGGSVAGSSASHTLATNEIPSHIHPGVYVPGPFQVPTGGPNPTVTAVSGGTTSPAGGGGAHSHNLSANFTGDATSVLQPYLTVIYIIKT
jgi:microcystin-dependent protein